MKKYLLYSMLLLAQSIQAQTIETPFCATDQLHEQKMATDTAYAHQFEINQQLIREFCDPHNHAYNENTRDLVVIPMVVHIVSPPGTAIGAGNNLTDAQVEEGLQLLNDAFANAGSFNTPDGVDTEIQFCLARRDPDGQPTNGITRHYSNVVAEADCGGNGFIIGNETALFSLSNWDCYQYVNVYLVTDITDNGYYGCSVAGYAALGSPCGYMVQESQFWATTDGTQVTAHEMGHFFNLWHTFQGGCTNDNCLVDGDAVCDTPPDNGIFTACDANTCNTDTPDLPDDTRNYMDYTTCIPWHFTPGQKMRMTASLQTAQSSLLNSQGCLPALPLDAALIFNALDNTCGTALCPEITLKNNGINTLNSIEITYNVNGGANQIYNYSLPLITNATANVTLPCLTVSVGANTLNITVTQVNGSADGYAPNSTISATFEVLSTPTLTIAQSDSTHCGYNGFVQLQATGGEAPYQYQISGNPNWQLSPIFSNLQNIPYTFTVKGANNCTSTLAVTLPDICPPCVSGIINEYAPVTAFCGDATLEISNTNGFQVGGKVLLIQMQGAGISENNDATFGDILDYGNAGNYEFNRIGSISGNTITFQHNILRTYDVQGKVQLITVPEYTDVSVCNLSCLPWNGETGGVLILDASGTITMAGNIDVSQKGFRGGLVDHNGGYTNEISYYYDNPEAAGKKGEGIALYLAGKEYGKGKQANGGGGGHNHNAGGGGGANGGNGGFGGFAYNDNNGNPDTRGVGGSPALIDNLNNKLFMGGGGGAGHSNWCCAAGTSGGNGGGILIVKANSIATNNSFILANGENALSTFQPQQQSPCGWSNSCDGAGGGGAGGTVFIDANTITNPLTINAIGGNGGDVYEPIGHVGPGGGGSGGYIIHANTTSANEVINIAGGINGIQQFPIGPHGATQGQTGIIRENTTNPIANVPYNNLQITTITQQSDCNTALNTVIITATGGTPPYQYSFNNGTWQANDIFQALDEGSYIFSVIDACQVQKDTLVQLISLPFLADSLIYQQPVTCTQQGKIVIAGTGGTPPYQYQIDGGDWQDTGTFSPLAAGTYTIVIKDANCCTVSNIFTIENNSSTPLLTIDVLQNITCDTTGAAILTLSGSNGIYPQYNLDGDTVQSNPIFTNLAAGSHTVTVIDELGCSGSITFDIADESQMFTVNNPQQICLGDTYTINGNTYTTSGEYTDTLQSVSLCDSIVVTQLTVNNPQNITQNATSCDPADVGSITTTYTAATGCDSTVTVITTLLASYDITQNATSCDPADVGSVSNTYTAATGCDSTVTVITTLVIPNCDDGLCGTTDSYDTTTCNCINTPITPPNCNDNDCNTADVYNFATCLCENNPITPDACDDGLCGTTDSYNVTACQCEHIPITPPNCNDNDCSTTDSYNAATCQCEHTPITPPDCNDNDCNTNDIFNEATCECEHTSITTPNCDDNNPATTDTYNTETCECEHTNNTNIVLIPNAFSPNGDGINDVFRVVATNALDIHMLIYNRWGEVVYDNGNTSPQWNGTYKGKQQEIGVYVYLITITYTDGTAVIKKGNVTLIY